MFIYSGNPSAPAAAHTCFVGCNWSLAIARICTWSSYQYYPFALHQLGLAIFWYVIISFFFHKEVPLNTFPRNGHPDGHKPWIRLKQKLRA